MDIFSNLEQKQKQGHDVSDDDQRQDTIDSIRKGEKKLHVSQEELTDMNIDQLSQYLNDLRSRYKSERKDTKEKAARADEAQQQDQTDSNAPVSEKEQNSNAETAILPIRCLRCQEYTEHSEEKYDDYEDWRLFVCEKCGLKSYVPKK